MSILPFGVDDDGPSDEAEPGEEQRLFIVVFRGLERETIVAASPVLAPGSGAAVLLDRFGVTGFLKAAKGLLFTKPLDQGPHRGPHVGDAVSLRSFLEQHPHPAPQRPECKTAIRDLDWEAGARGCGWCRDRALLVQVLARVAACRVVPGARW